MSKWKGSSNVAVSKFLLKIVFNFILFIIFLDAIDDIDSLEN